MRRVGTRKPAWLFGASLSGLVLRAMGGADRGTTCNGDVPAAADGQCGGSGPSVISLAQSAQ